MHVKRISLGFILLCALFLSISFGVAVSPAAATGSPWAIWKIKVTFPNNTINTELIVSIGHTTSTGQRVIDMQQTFPVTCQAVGNPTVQNNQATFDGSSYFSCEVPSIKEKVLQMTNGQLVIADQCASRKGYVVGSLSLDGNPALANPKNPLFHRDDILFGLPLDTATQQANIVAKFEQALSGSDDFAIHPAGHVVAAVFDKTGPNTFTPTFSVNGTALNATPATLSQTFLHLSTLESTVYVGYSPLLNEYYHGTLTSLLVDPHCTGQG